MNRRGFFGVLSGATGVAVGLPKAMQPEVAKPVAMCNITTHSVGQPWRYHGVGLLERRVFEPDEILQVYRAEATGK